MLWWKLLTLLIIQKHFFDWEKSVWSWKQNWSCFLGWRKISSPPKIASMWSPIPIHAWTAEESPIWIADSRVTWRVPILRSLVSTIGLLISGCFLYRMGVRRTIVQRLESSSLILSNAPWSLGRQGRRRGSSSVARGNPDGIACILWFKPKLQEKDGRDIIQWRKRPWWFCPWIRIMVHISMLPPASNTLDLGFQDRTNWCEIYFLMKDYQGLPGSFGWYLSAYASRGGHHPYPFVESRPSLVISHSNSQFLQRYYGDALVHIKINQEK